MEKIVSFALGCIVGVCGACGAQDGGEDGAARGAERKADATPQSFAVRLDSATTTENVIAQIARAGREEIAAMCEKQPGGSMRIYNPLASGAYEDISCASVLSGDSAIGEAGAALVIDEADGPIGEAQQNWSPFGIGCTLVMLGFGALTRLGCKQNYHGSERCGWEAFAGTGAMGLVLCQFF